LIYLVFTAMETPEQNHLQDAQSEEKSLHRISSMLSTTSSGSNKPSLNDIEHEIARRREELNALRARSGDRTNNLIQRAKGSQERYASPLKMAQNLMDTLRHRQPSLEASLSLDPLPRSCDPSTPDVMAGFPSKTPPNFSSWENGSTGSRRSWGSRDQGERSFNGDHRDRDLDSSRESIDRDKYSNSGGRERPTALPHLSPRREKVKQVLKERYMAAEAEMDNGGTSTSRYSFGMNRDKKIPHRNAEVERADRTKAWREVEDLKEKLKEKEKEINALKDERAELDKHEKKQTEDYLKLLDEVKGLSLDLEAKKAEIRKVNSELQAQKKQFDDQISEEAIYSLREELQQEYAKKFEEERKVLRDMQKDIEEQQKNFEKQRLELENASFLDDSNVSLKEDVAKLTEKLKKLEQDKDFELHQLNVHLQKSIALRKKNGLSPITRFFMTLIIWCIIAFVCYILFLAQQRRLGDVPRITH